MRVLIDRAVDPLDGALMRDLTTISRWQVAIRDELSILLSLTHSIGDVRVVCKRKLLVVGPQASGGLMIDSVRLFYHLFGLRNGLWMHQVRLHAQGFLMGAHLK